MTSRLILNTVCSQSHAPRPPTTWSLQHYPKVPCHSLEQETWFGLEPISLTECCSSREPLSAPSPLPHLQFTEAVQSSEGRDAYGVNLIVLQAPVTKSSQKENNKIVSASQDKSRCHIQSEVMVAHAGANSLVPGIAGKSP